MNVKPLKAGDIVYDSLPFSMSSGDGADKLKCDTVALYLGVAGPNTVSRVLDARKGVLYVTLAGKFDGRTAAVQLGGLNAPHGASVFLDLEGSSVFSRGAGMTIKAVNDWASVVSDAGYMPGLYVGSPQPLTSDELWHLKVERYWRGQGSMRDRYGALAEPTGCGWCMTQAYPSIVSGGILVDANMVSQDYRGRTPSAVFP